MDSVKSGNEYYEIGPSASNHYCSSNRRQVGAEEHEVGLCHCHIYENTSTSNANNFLPNVCGKGYSEERLFIVLPAAV